MVSWAVPILSGLMFLNSVIDVKIIIPIAIIVVGFFTKSYIENTENLNFYYELVEENRKNYEYIIDKLQDEIRQRDNSFNNEVKKNIENINKKLSAYCDKKEILQEK